LPSGMFFIRRVLSQHPLVGSASLFFIHYKTSPRQHPGRQMGLLPPYNLTCLLYDSWHLCRVQLHVISTMSLCMAEGGVAPRGPAQIFQLFQLDVWLVCRLPPQPAQLLLAPPHLALRLLCFRPFRQFPRLSMIMRAGEIMSRRGHTGKFPGILSPALMALFCAMRKRFIN
jgi:hypothetical protein